jgi:hypothetical protein
MVVTSDLLKLLITNDKYNRTLFKELVQVEFGLSELTAARVALDFFYKGDWANYIYVIDGERAMCSREKMIFQDEVLENSEIICFTT